MAAATYVSADQAVDPTPPRRQRFRKMMVALLAVLALVCAATVGALGRRVHELDKYRAHVEDENALAAIVCESGSPGQLPAGSEHGMSQPTLEFW